MKNFSIPDISSRANVLSKITNHGQTLIYEDHRTILTVLFALQKQLDKTGPIDIVMFDKHDDFMDPSPEALEKIAEFIKKPSLAKLYTLVEFDLNGIDDDWVKAGMELGLIGNVFLFNAEVSQIDFVKEYQTLRFGIKKMYNIGAVWDALDGRGYLSDLHRLNLLDKLWEDFGWTFEDAKFHFKNDRNPYILDIDLDCFTCNVYCKTVAIASEILEQKLYEGISSTHHSYYDSVSFVKKLAEDSCVNTICFESNYCGGIRQAHQIFNKIDELFFDSELGG